VGRERGGHQSPETDPVGNQAGDENDDAEAGQTTPGDGTQFGLGEAVLFGPLAENAGSDGEADPRGRDRHETCPEEPLGVDARRRTGVGGGVGGVLRRVHAISLA
jgi:hypothetical protein